MLNAQEWVGGYDMNIKTAPVSMAVWAGLVGLIAAARESGMAV
jgi:hypothetical protein